MLNNTNNLKKVVNLFGSLVFLPYLCNVVEKETETTITELLTKLKNYIMKTTAIINVLGTNFEISANKGKKIQKWGGLRNEYRAYVENLETGVKISFQFWDSEANHDKQYLDELGLTEAFGCFISDALAYENCQDVDDFVEEFGCKIYNEAKKAYENCGKAKIKFDCLTDGANIIDFYNEFVEDYNF